MIFFLEKCIVDDKQTIQYHTKICLKKIPYENTNNHLKNN